MPTSRRTLLKNSAAAAAIASLDWTRAQAQAENGAHRRDLRPDRPVRGGPGSVASLGRYANRDRPRHEKGGVGGKYKVAPVNADSQSKPDVAINEAHA